MQIQNVNNTSFTGGYKFIGMSKEARAELNDVVKKGKTIYDSFQGNSDNVFMVAKDQFHKAILLFIKKYNLNCKYYPEIKASMDFKLGHPEKAEQIIETQMPEDILFDEELTNKLSEYQRKRYVRKNQNEYVSNILNLLKLDMDETTCTQKLGVKIFQNKNHTKEIYVSPPNENNTHYVKVFAKVLSSSHDSAKLYEINLNDKKIIDYTADIDKWGEFNQKFDRTLIK